MIGDVLLMWSFVLCFCWGGGMPGYQAFAVGLILQWLIFIKYEVAKLKEK